MGITEVSGGLNFQQPYFSEIVEHEIRGEPSTPLINPKDRLARFGDGLLTHLCETHDYQMGLLNAD